MDMVYIKYANILDYPVHKQFFTCSKSLIQYKTQEEKLTEGIILVQNFFALGKLTFAIEEIISIKIHEKKLEDVTKKVGKRMQYDLQSFSDNIGNRNIHFVITINRF